ncbi:MAG TPA: STAS domain-containing protein [Roseateles sp.]
MSDSKPADPKEGDSFFRKVARFVANPTTDWSEINSRQDDPEGELAKAELRAMVERKRRNDFVRKRELDMLRRIRREGLTPEQLAALASSPSRMGDDERLSETNSKIDLGVKAKIDEIEQQMVGESFATTQSVPKQQPGFFETSTRPVAFASNATPPPAVMDSSRGRVSEFSSPREVQRLSAPPPPAAVTMGAAIPPLSDSPPSRLPDLPVLDMPLSFTLAESSAPLEVQEVVHDPELDEAVIAFANADYDSSERALTELVRPGGSRNLHGETWLVLFDHYRATGAQGKFEALAVEYAQQFGLSAPQWFSMPKLVAETTRQAGRTPMGKAGHVSWTAPSTLTAEDVATLQKRSETLPMPWVLDWSAVDEVDIDAAIQLRQLLRTWASQQIDQRWVGGDHLLNQLKELAPVGERDTDPALWMLRLEALRLANRPDQFDEAAIDYCVTYEVSPPSWERAKCRVRFGGEGSSTNGPATSALPSEAQSTFLDTGVAEPHVAQLELMGQLSGDISENLRAMAAEVGEASLINISCTKLIRLDFMAAGDLLNWVLSRRAENRSVVFTDAHRLVALFFGAMGINEHAKVKVRIN